MRMLHCVAALALVACGSSGEGPSAPSSSVAGTGQPTSPAAPAPSAVDTAPESPASPPQSPPRDIVAVTFNTGMHDAIPTTRTQEQREDRRGLLRQRPRLEPGHPDTKAWLQTVDPDVVGPAGDLRSRGVPEHPGRQEERVRLRDVEARRPHRRAEDPRPWLPGRVPARSPRQLRRREALVRQVPGLHRSGVSRRARRSAGATCGHGARVGRGVIELASEAR